MEIKARVGEIGKERAEAALIGHFEDDREPGSSVQSMDRSVSGQIRDILRSKEFEGKHLQLTLVHSHARTGPKRILLVGLGRRKDCSLEKVRKAAAKAAQHVRGLGLSGLCTPILTAGLSSIPDLDAAGAMTEGFVLGLYRFAVYKTESDVSGQDIRDISILLRDRRSLERVRQAVAAGQILGEATNLARDWANTPSNDLTPRRLSELARGIADELSLQCEILDKSQMESLGMGALLGVSRGSQEPPKFIILKYHGDKPSTRPIALVGKSITFDTGGISLKPSDRMEQMKYDMSGGAAVLAAIKAAAQLKIPVNVIGFLPATENMPGGSAMKPGDVVKTLSGKTVEVINTDAEGRLILADALNYALRYRPAAILDLATLTGACTIALGHHAIGLLGNHAALLEKVKAAGAASGERVWELPLWEEYFDQIKSDVADIKNVGGRGGGAITAAAFLGKFVNDYPWAHLDIASTAWADEPRPYAPKGATGVGVRLLVHFLLASAGGRHPLSDSSPPPPRSSAGTARGKGRG